MGEALWGIDSVWRSIHAEVGERVTGITSKNQDAIEIECEYSIITEGNVPRVGSTKVSRSAIGSGAAFLFARSLLYKMTSGTTSCQDGRRSGDKT